MENNTLVLFEGKKIRKIWHDKQWYFNIVDVIILTAISSTRDKRHFWFNVFFKHKGTKETELDFVPLCLKFSI
jgi:hypothetical protein